MSESSPSLFRAKSALFYSLAASVLVVGLSISFTVLKAGSQVSKTISGIGSDIHESTTQLNLTTKQVSKSVADTSSMLNANLIHLDLILGRAERVSRKQETFWDVTSNKMLQTLSHADDLMVGLDTTNQAVAQNVDKTTQHLNTSLDIITTGVNTNLEASQETMVTLNAAAFHLDSLLQSPDILGTLHNIQSTTNNLADTSGHLNYIANDLQGKTTQLMHPSKKKQAANIFLNLLNLTAHTGETWYYLRK